MVNFYFGADDQGWVTFTLALTPMIGVTRTHAKSSGGAFDSDVDFRRLSITVTSP